MQLSLGHNADLLIQMFASLKQQSLYSKLQGLFMKANNPQDAVCSVNAGHKVLWELCKGL